MSYETSAGAERREGKRIGKRARAWHRPDDRLTSEEFNPENYKDEYRIRVLAMLDEKSKGKDVTIAPPAPERGGKVVDIMEALKRSMEKFPAKRKPGLAGAAKKIKRLS